MIDHSIAFLIVIIRLVVIVYGVYIRIVMYGVYIVIKNGDRGRIHIGNYIHWIIYGRLLVLLRWCMLHIVFIIQQESQ